jgi:hypothetical protein
MQKKNPIEAVYEFPLDPKASVSGFWAEIDGNRIDGIIKVKLHLNLRAYPIQEKEEAKNVYDDAIASGHGAYLLEESESK